MEEVQKKADVTQGQSRKLTLSPGKVMESLTLSHFQSHYEQEIWEQSA